jgi:hypothetical protein
MPEQKSILRICHGYRVNKPLIEKKIVSAIMRGFGKARQSNARHGKARQGKARQGKARQSNTKFNISRSKELN